MRLAALAIVVILGGCADRDPSSTVGTPSGESRTTFPTTMQLTDCHGIRSHFIWPPTTTPAGEEVPPGWERDPPDGTDYVVFIVECARLSIGHFERGPIHFLVEFHDGISPPQSCADREPAPTEAQALRSIWFDDPEIVDYFSTVLHMPAHLGIFGKEKTDAPSLSYSKWTWMEPDGPQSELIFTRLDGPMGGGLNEKRLYWHHGQSVSLMDFADDSTQPLVTPYETHGWFREPMMYADSGAEAYAGITVLMDPGTAFTGSIQRFGDMSCQTPAP